MITQKRDLRTGKTAWSTYSVPRVPSQVLDHDQKADVLVIGAGISGAMIAQELSEAGLSVIMVDRRKPMMGSTAATTALLQYELDVPLLELGKKIGIENATRAWRRSRLALESLAAKIQGLNIDCNLKRTDTLFLAGSDLGAGALRDEGNARNAIGLHADYLTTGDLKERYHIDRKAALHTYDNLSVNPLRLTAGFLLKAIERKAVIYKSTEIVDIRIKKGSIVAATQGGPLITTRYAVYATGYELPRRLQSQQHAIKSTWVIATRPQKQKLVAGLPLIWEASDPYLYIRTTADNRIICGGEDEDFSDDEARDALIPVKTQALEKKLGKLLPHIDCRAVFSWAGCFGTSTTGLPSIGHVPGMQDCFAAMAYGGNGITFSRIAAEIIRSEITGRRDPDKDLFAFSR